MAIRIRRREFIVTLGGAAAATWPLAVHAQQPRRIGVLLPFSDSDPEARSWIAAFEERLQSLGWGRGRSIRIEYRWAGADISRLRTDAAELVRITPDVLFGPGPAMEAFNRETHSLPIVFVQVADPVELGYVASLARPGGNITGFVNFEYSIGGKWLGLLKDAAPRTSRVAVLFDPNNFGQAPFLRAVEGAAPSFGIQATRTEVRNAAEIERAMNAFAQQPNGAVLLVPNAVTILHRDLIAALAARLRLPTVCPYRFFATSGGFISYGANLPDHYRQAASYVDRILNGAKPSDLPVQLASKFELVVNLKTAKALGLTIPEPLLQTADEVIE